MRPEAVDFLKINIKNIKCRLTWTYPDTLFLQASAEYIMQLFKLLYLHFLARFSGVLRFEAGKRFTLRVFTSPQKWVWLIGGIYNTKGPAEWIKQTNYQHNYYNKTSSLLLQDTHTYTYYLQIDVPTPVDLNSITLVSGSRVDQGVDPWGPWSSRFCLISIRYPGSSRWKWQ